MMHKVELAGSVLVIEMKSQSEIHYVDIEDIKFISMQEITVSISSKSKNNDLRLRENKIDKKELFNHINSLIKQYYKNSVKQRKEI